MYKLKRFQGWCGRSTRKYDEYYDRPTYSNYNTYDYNYFNHDHNYASCNERHLSNFKPHVENREICFPTSMPPLDVGGFERSIWGHEDETIHNSFHDNGQFNLQFPHNASDYIIVDEVFCSDEDGSKNVNPSLGTFWEDHYVQLGPDVETYSTAYSEDSRSLDGYSQDFNGFSYSSSTSGEFTTQYDDGQGPSGQQNAGSCESHVPTSHPQSVYEVSEAEAGDFCDPRWEGFKLLANDDDRYEAVREAWTSVKVPNPFLNLTHHGYRFAGLPPASAVPGTSGQKRRFEEMDNADNGGPPNKRQRFASCVEVFDSKMRAEKDRYLRETDDLKSQKRRQMRELKKLNKMSRWDRYVSWPMKNAFHEIRECASFFNSCFDRAWAKHDEVMGTLSKHREEALKFYKFYSNLKNYDGQTKNVVLLNEQQLLEIEETDHMYELYEKFYR